MTIIRIIAACIAASFAVRATAADLKVGFGWEKPPYLWTEQGQIKGIEIDIVRAVLAEFDRKLEPKAMPNMRMMATFGLEGFDIATGLQEGDIPGAYYSEPYLAYANFAVTRKSKNIALNDVHDIFAHSLVSWQNAYQDLHLDKRFPDEVKAQKAAGNYNEFPTMDRVVRLFWAGRVEILLCDQYIFQWFTARLPSHEIDTSDALEFHALFPAHYVRAAFKDKALRDQFDSGLRKLRNSGDYDRILARYGKNEAGGRPTGNAPQ